ncbi:AI-2E family transporter [Herbaspirillum sp. HC18]|nr:AI-2E family transporter [Herbaspirillum sp. HC18]
MKDAPPPRRRKPLRVEVPLSNMLSVVLVVGTIWLLWRLLPVLLMLVAALLIVGTLNPAVSRLEERGWHRNKAIALIFTALLIFTTAVVVLTLPALLTQMSSLIDQEATLRQHVVKLLSSSRITAALADSLHDLRYDALLKSSAASLLDFSKRMVEVFAYSIAAVFLALYMMIDRDRLRGALFVLVPRSHHVRLARIIINLQTIVGGYIRGQVITCLMIGVFMLVLLTVAGVPNALALSTFGAIADVLPFVGPFLTIAPAVAAAYTVSPWTAMIVFLLMLAYEEFESRIVIPLVYGRALRLPSSVVLFSLIAGAQLAGVVGALLALPVAATILMLIEELRVELPGDTREPDSVETAKQEEAYEQEYLRRTENVPVERAAAVAVDISERAVENNQDKPAGKKTSTK